MITKFGVGILATALIFLSATPVTSFAATSDKKEAQIKKITKKLKSLPNGGAPANVLTNYVTKLAKLDPKKGNKYFRTGLMKLFVGPGSSAAAATLAAAVIKIIKKSALPDNQIRKIVKQITRVNPTFIPYQTSVTHDLALSPV